MKYSAYPVYKDSGVEWLGEIPEHWEVMLLKRVANVRYGLGQPPPESINGTPLIRATNIKSGSISEESMLYVDPDEVPESRDAILSPGEIIVVRSGAYTGDSAIIPIAYAGAIAGYDMVLTIKKGFSFFFAWQILSAEVRELQFGFHRLRAAQPHLNAEELKETIVVVPPFLQQQAIASFLDRETAKIDALIAKKERLIELLQEKRTAIISHAVTKGLDPTVPLKDLGIEWLREIPTHWEKTRIKYALHQIIDTEHKTAPSYPDGKYLIVRTSNVRNGQLVFDDAKYTDHEGFREWTKRGKPEPGDILFTREAPAGEACLVPENLSLCLGQRMVLFRVNHQMLDENYGIRSLYGGIAAEFISSLSQGSTVAHFNMADIGNIPLLLPPLEEQAAIASYLDRETAKIDALIRKIRQGIEKLKEYRTALISSAVTGTIDVREPTD